jgi:hypothetical protein
MLYIHKLILCPFISSNKFNMLRYVKSFVFCRISSYLLILRIFWNKNPPFPPKNQDSIDNTPCSLAITIRVNSVGHLCIGLSIINQTQCFVDYFFTTAVLTSFTVPASTASGLSVVSLKHQHRPPQRRQLLPAYLRNQSAPNNFWPSDGQKADNPWVQSNVPRCIPQCLDRAKSLRTLGFLCTGNTTWVSGLSSLTSPNGLKNPLHGLTPIFPPVAGHQG